MNKYWTNLKPNKNNMNLINEYFIEQYTQCESWENIKDMERDLKIFDEPEFRTGINRHYYNNLINIYKIKGIDFKDIITYADKDTLIKAVQSGEFQKEHMDIRSTIEDLTIMVGGQKTHGYCYEMAEHITSEELMILWKYGDFDQYENEHFEKKEYIKINHKEKYNNNQN